MSRKTRRRMKRAMFYGLLSLLAIAIGSVAKAAELPTIRQPGCPSGVFFGLRRIVSKLNKPELRAAHCRLSWDHARCTRQAGHLHICFQPIGKACVPPRALCVSIAGVVRE